MHISIVERINLLEFLEEEHPDVPPPPEEAAEHWTVAQIQAHYEGASVDAPLVDETAADAEAAAAACHSTMAIVQPRVTSSSTASQLPSNATTAATVADTLFGATHENGSATAGRNGPCNGSTEVHSGGTADATNDHIRETSLLNEDPRQPGGGRVQQLRFELHPVNAPAKLRTHQLAATVAGYRAAAIAHGIPFRRHGLFPPGDQLLAELAAAQGSHPFEKHMAGGDSSYQALPQGGWTTGDAACRAGLDLRMFYQEAKPGAEHGTLLAAARLGEAASIGAGCWVSAHGGAVESLLDEATAECAKMEWAPTLATLEAAFKITKAVPLNTTLRIACEIAAERGVRCWVNGSVTDAAGKIVYATCQAQLIDLAQLWDEQSN